MNRLFKDYKNLNPDVLNLIFGGFFIKLVNATFFLILNIYLAKQGYADHQVANFVSYRFLGMLIIALPLGFYIKSRRLIPWFYFSSFMVPFSALMVLVGVELEITWLIYASLLTGGTALSGFNIASLPFILRNEQVSYHSEALALNFSMFSLSIFLTGIFNFLLPLINPDFFTEKVLIGLFGIVGIVSLLFIRRISTDEVIPSTVRKRLDLRQYDWGLITRALIPKVLLATGAGLTIQFINLFFYHVFGIDFNEFSLMGTFMAILVVLAVLVVPMIKKRFGYNSAILLTQSSAVLALIVLATTQYYSYLDVALYIAILCFIIRQPLMNMANPITSELTMYYVGKNNQELVSAINASIWAGSRFFSSQIFRWMRGQDYEFATIFLLTALLYGIATIWYFFLIKDFRRRQAAGKLEF